MLIAVVPNQNKTENHELVRAVCDRLTAAGANVRVVCSEILHSSKELSFLIVSSPVSIFLIKICAKSFVDRP